MPVLLLHSLDICRLPETASASSLCPTAPHSFPSILFLLHLHTQSGNRFWSVDAAAISSHYYCPCINQTHLFFILASAVARRIGIRASGSDATLSLTRRCRWLVKEHTQTVTAASLLLVISGSLASEFLLHSPAALAKFFSLFLLCVWSILFDVYSILWV